MLGAAGAVVKLNIQPTIVVGDDGGWELTLTGVFPTNHSYYVDIIRSGEDFSPQRCYSGIVGNGDRCVPTNVSKMVCYIPPLPIANGYDIRVQTTPHGALQDTQLDCLNVLHRSFATNLYTLRSHFPPPRDVGAYGVDEED